jgi:hypothetical protein
MSLVLLIQTDVDDRLEATSLVYFRDLLRLSRHVLAPIQASALFREMRRRMDGGL